MTIVIRVVDSDHAIGFSLTLLLGTLTESKNRLMKLFVTSFFLGILISTNLNCQTVSPDVIATCGDFFSNSSGSVSWTCGEPMGETFGSTNNYVTQGFQQPWDLSTGVPIVLISVDAEIFPNPTSDLVNLQFGENSNGVYLIEVFDILGETISSVQFTATSSAHTVIKFSDLANGIYFLTVRKMDGTESTTFKITKNS